MFPDTCYMMQEEGITYNDVRNLNSQIKLRRLKMLTFTLLLLLVSLLGGLLVLMRYF